MGLLREPFHEDMTMLDVRENLHPTEDDAIIIHRQQDISDAFLSNLHSERMASAHLREAEYMHVADVPAAVFDLWHALGYDPWRMEAREIIRLLKRDHLDAFIATSKAV